ncbi:CDP-glycerol glycerophosphotransferase family protein [Paenibacillus sp. R14(2021)]|uniref:bifunctional glycosyltransferase/CDP-glycerol:glycerophosphate glycerophosphotransferase n=1 Tax=Paenibacillus sp. R14(2021) TaxID=2859228 RepID=UPI001C612CC7|nr:CDP-glycerol glycerophosphotransferase family protein [Paenibacillus sp. R14(2021)]
MEKHNESEQVFLFTIIMAVHNVERYIKEAVDSVITQTLNFNKHIQLILVNDGSSDNSGLLCKAFRDQYPANIIYLEQENAGVSSARNQGLMRAQGKYVNFLDPDDKLSPTVLERVFQFFENHCEVTDVVSIPMLFFDGRTGDHQLNYKFTKDRIIDLNSDYKSIQLSMSSAFVKRNAFNGMNFNEKMIFAEDAELLNRILLKTNKLGVVTGVNYLYRKRLDGSSAIQSVSKTEVWYLNSIESFSLSLINYCIMNYSEIPHYIQYVIMYDLQWKLKETDISALPNTQQELYMNKLSHVLGFIENNIIMEQKNINIHQKLFALQLKYKALNLDYKYTNVFTTKDVKKYLDRYYLCSLNEQAATIEILEIRNGMFILEGNFGSCFLKHEIQIYAEFNNHRYPVSEVRRDLHAMRSLGQVIKEYYGFEIKIPLTKLNNKKSLTLFVEVEGVSVPLNVKFNRFSHLSSRIKNSYYTNEDWIASFDSINRSFIIEPKSAYTILKKEVRLLQRVMRDREVGSRKAVVARICSHLLRMTKKKEVWLFMDRQDKADDNAEHLFKYSNKLKDRVKKYYVIQEHSDDYSRLKREGKVVKWGSNKHKLLQLIADKVVSSHVDEWVINPYFTLDKYYRDLMKYDFVFLQHGITKDDISSWLNKYNKNIKLFITAAHMEYNSIIYGSYGYEKSAIAMTGFPRFDNLTNEDQRKILIAPTWRKALVRDVDQQTGIRPYSDIFKESKYFNFYNKLINDDRVIQAAKQYKYSIVFFPHPNIHQQLKDFDLHPDVEFVELNANYQNLFKESSMLITDYSSIFFDFAYLKKPVVYSHFEPSQYKSGYFDYSEMGFGEICETYNELVQTMIGYMKLNCQMKEEYKERVNRFFAFTDRDNSARVYQAITQL